MHLKKLFPPFIYVGLILIIALSFLDAGASPVERTVGADCGVEYVVDSDWGTGFGVTVQVTNYSGAEINGWTFEWAFANNQQITSIWDANFTQTGADIAVTDVGWNAGIPDGGTVSFGFNGSYSGSNELPSPFYLNGLACAPNLPPIPTVGASPTPTPAISPTPSPTPTGGGSVTVELQQNSSYNGGFGAEFLLTNNSGTNVEGWTFVCDLDFSVVSAWNANWSHSAGQYTFTDVGWNSTIAPNQTRNIGFDGAGVLTANSPTNCTFNGQPITVPVTYSTPPDSCAGISILPADDNDTVNQITIPHGDTDFTLSQATEPNPTYSVVTNNGDVLSTQIVSTDTLRLTGLDGGRAGLKITEINSGVERCVGVRVQEADGTLPGLPDYVGIGSVSEDSSADLDFWYDYDTDLTNRRMDVRYIYLNGGPVNGWRTWSGAIPQPGGRAISFIRHSQRMGMIPAFVYYNIPDGGESYPTNTQHMQDVVYMEGYFNDLQLALDIINTESPDDMVMLIFEPDFLGYLAQNADDPTMMMAQTNAAYSSGALDPATDPIFPDTVRGLVEAINYLVDSRAPQAYFGWQLNLWALPPGGYTTPIPGNGIVHLTDSMGIPAGRSAIHAEASAITDYYLNAGIATHNADFLSIDKYGLDAAATSDPNDPVNSIWFWNNDHWGNYLTVVDAMRDTSGLPLVLWQLPVGHINSTQYADPYDGGTFDDHLNTNRQYEDSAPTYFLGDTFIPGAGNRYTHFASNDANDPLLTADGTTVTWGSHMSDTAETGVTVVLFGAGVGDSTDGVGSPPTDDYWWVTKVQDYYAGGKVPAISNPHLDIALTNPTDINLAWDINNSFCQYELHTATDPYFTPTPSTLLTTLAHPIAQHTIPNAINLPPDQHFYRIQATQCADNDAFVSQETGTFSFAIVAGN